ncbi:helix-turn-helix domain-containing protein [Archangium violaceum]|uniref:helix-turn-helix domain-containing protein n=1 Tax=Archangium violaceum TaxID=83451 RepID=UPI00193BF2B1|nr:helix-turn-helix domain-containing protein [Archangium violaceum]
MMMKPLPDEEGAGSSLASQTQDDQADELAPANQRGVTKKPKRRKSEGISPPPPVLPPDYRCPICPPVISVRNPLIRVIDDRGRWSVYSAPAHYLSESRPQEWVCRRCTERWRWKPYKFPTEAQLDDPCVECGEVLDLQERAVEVQRQLLAHLAGRPSPLAVPGPEASPASSRPGLTCTVKEAAALLGCGTTKVYELLSHDQLVASKIGRKRLVLRASVEALLQRGGIGSTPERPKKAAPAKTQAKDAKALAAAISKLPLK